MKSPKKTTESQRDGDQRKGGDENLRIKGSQSDRVTQATEETEERPPLAARVRTLQEAVEISLSDKYRSGEPDLVFVFARALKAFEATVGTRLNSADFDPTFNLWWSKAQSVLPSGTDREETRLLLLNAYGHARSPLGSNNLIEAIERAKRSPAPEASRYASNQGLQLLVSVCYHLQLAAGFGPFFLSTRDAARILGFTDPKRAQRILEGLVMDAILTVAEKGRPGSVGGKATRYHYFPLTLRSGTLS